MGLGGTNDAQLMQDMRCAVFVRSSTQAFVESEHLVFERLKRFENFIHTGVESSGALSKSF